MVWFSFSKFNIFILISGECICPIRVTGEKCDQCTPLTYGFDPIVGCEDCNCDPHGVQINNLQCDLFNGSCALVYFYTCIIKLVE